MNPESLEMGKTHPEWGKQYEAIAQHMNNQAAELRSLYRKVLKMRYETSVLGVKYLQASKILQQTKEDSEVFESSVVSNE